MTAAEIITAHEKAQIEDSPFSESFTLSPIIPEGESVTIRGIFNSANESNEARRTTIPAPRVLLYAKPTYIAGSTVLTRENGSAYIMGRCELDDSAVGVVIYLSKN